MWIMSCVVSDKKFRNNVFSVIEANPHAKMDFGTNLHIVSDITVPESSSNHSITTLLNYCKHKLLNPYLRLLSVMSLRPLVIIQEDHSLLSILNYTYVIILTLFMVLGYILQYMSCFRRDRGFCYDVALTTDDVQFSTINLKADQERICYGSTIFSFVIPSCLHFIAYIHAVYIFRSSDDDQLPNLMERVFLASTNLSNGFVFQKKLIRVLWIVVFVSVVWMVLSLASVNFMMMNVHIDLKWIPERSDASSMLLKILLVASMLWHDCIQAIIIANYCLQAQLLTSYVQFLKARLVQYSTEPIEWMRDIEEFKKMLTYLNHVVSPAICIFTFVNISYALSGLLWIFNFDQVDIKTLPIVGISVLNIGLWISISIVPFIQAARLTSACEGLKTVGQEVRIRPFVHIGTPRCELDSILLYTSSLKITAKLFSLTIKGSYLWLVITVFSICILVLGMCHFFS